MEINFYVSCQLGESEATEYYKTVTESTIIDYLYKLGISPLILVNRKQENEIPENQIEKFKEYLLENYSCKCNFLNYVKYDGALNDGICFINKKEWKEGYGLAIEDFIKSERSKLNEEILKYKVLPYFPSGKITYLSFKVSDLIDLYIHDCIYNNIPCIFIKDITEEVSEFLKKYNKEKSLKRKLIKRLKKIF